MSEDYWYKDAIFYELRVRSFYDSDNDGIGDFKGLTEKLDYLRDLGVTTLWLLPFYPSPLKDDGYDTADYTTVHRDVGTFSDFKKFLKASHDRGLKVVTELVLNHTSDQHPWFERARRAAPGSKWRDFYVWSDDPRKYAEARIIFSDFEHSNWTWDPVAKAYYWHRFYSHQPDLNFENLEVHKAVFEVVDKWFDAGIDGLRLDAVPYLFEQEGTNCENLPQTHGFLKKLRSHIDKKYKDRMLLAEANQWPEDAVTYFGDADECHMAFHFPIMPRLFMALRMEDNFPIIDILEQTPEIAESCQWAIFLRNHDELTLEMVTDEERDYMVDAYAAEREARINLGIRRRLAPLLENNRRRIELMNALLFSLPGTPVIYYGDEIGMGDNVYLGDRDGVRTPMQWSPDRNAGFSKANPQKLILPTVVDPEYHYEAHNVETQQANPSSLLWWMKRIIALRKQHPAFGRGTLEPLPASNRKVFSFLRRYGEDTLLVVVNLSRFAQYVELDLSEFKGSAPLELFGSQEFPPVGDLPYLLTLGPHNFYWFSLKGHGEQGSEAQEDGPPELNITGAWEELLKPRSPLEKLLLRYLPQQRWFRSKARPVKNVRINDSILLSKNPKAYLVVLDVQFVEGDPESYVLALSLVNEAETWWPVLAEVHSRSRRADANGLLVDASADPRVAAVLLDTIVRKRKLRGKNLELVGVPERSLKAQVDEELPQARALGVEQTNTSYLYGDRFIGKIVRKVEEGESIELELLRHITSKGFEHSPPLLGHLELRRSRGGTATVGILQGFVPNQGDAWKFTLDEVFRYFEQVLTQQHDAPPKMAANILARAEQPIPDAMKELLGNYPHMAEVLGTRTAEMHRVLADAEPGSSLEPDQFGSLSKRSFYQSLRNLSSRSFDLLRERIKSLPEEPQELGRELLKREKEVRGRLKPILDRTLTSSRIRVHGDYHLGQVLYTGRDFVIIDFEGEPARSLTDRRRRRSPMADVAGMLRSFHYAAHGSLTEQLGRVRPEDAEFLSPWASAWYNCISGAFVHSYLQAIDGANLVPSEGEELGLLLDVHLMEKSLYELGYELNNRPTWVAIPLFGLLEILDSDEYSK